MASLGIAFRDPVIRVSMLTIFFFGFSGAATTPYQSVVGIRELGLGDGFYATLIMLAATVNVCVSVSVGALADRIGRYRSLMLLVTLFGVTGYGAVFLLPSRISFVVAVLLLLPVYNSVSALLFANVRTATNRMGSGDAGSVNSTVRAAISLAWVLVPGLVAFALSGRDSMLPAYLFACGGAFACVLLVFFLLPKEATGPSATLTLADRFSFGAALSPPRVARLAAVAMMTAMVHMSDAVLPLILTGPAGGHVTDIGVMVGIVALLEIVFIFFWARVQARIGSAGALVCGAAVYVCYLASLGWVSRPWHVFALALPAALGAAALISVPITYLQDLIRNRPGLGSSLISVNFFLSAGLCAAIFALGTHVADYPGTARLSAATGVAGIVLLMLLDGRTIRRARAELA